MRTSAVIRIVGTEKPCCAQVARLLLQTRGRELKVYLPPEQPRQVRCRYCNAERTVQMYELVYPTRRLGGRRAVWIEAGVAELLPPRLAIDLPEAEEP